MFGDNCCFAATLTFLKVFATVVDSVSRVGYQSLDGILMQMILINKYGYSKFFAYGEQWPRPLK